MKKPSRAGDKSDGTDNSNQSKPTPDLYILKSRGTTAIEELGRIILCGQFDDTTRGSAAWALHRLAYLAVDTLGLVARKKPSELRAIAETTGVWPAFISPHADFAKANLELMSHLRLGERYFLRFTFPQSKRGKRWSLRTPANVCAVEMIKALLVRQCTCRALERDRRDKELRELYKHHGFKEPRITFQSAKLTKQILALEPLSLQTVDQWFEAGWNMLLEQTGGHPEKDEWLRALGSYRRNHTRTSPPGTKASESNIRDGIKERLRRAFAEVVRRSGEN